VCGVLYRAPRKDDRVYRFARDIPTTMVCTRLFGFSLSRLPSLPLRRSPMRTGVRARFLLRPSSLAPRPERTCSKEINDGGSFHLEKTFCNANPRIFASGTAFARVSRRRLNVGCLERWEGELGNRTSRRNGRPKSKLRTYVFFPVRRGSDYRV